MKAPLFKVEYRYKDGPWISIHESSLAGLCFETYKYEVNRNAFDPNRQFRCQVLFGGEYHTIEI